MFPGIGLGAVACRARTLPDELFLEPRARWRTWCGRRISRTGALYPPLREIRKISLAIAVSVATKAYTMKLARQSRPRNIRRSIEALMYRPDRGQEP